MINELATLKKNVSHLPTTIWLDENRTYLPHAPRIKFQCNNEQRNTRQFASMTISDNPECFNIPKNNIIKGKDLEKIRKFVIENKELLLALANNEINFTDDFLNNIKL